MINFRMRKLLARISLPFLTIWLCILPSRSYAFVPAAVGMYGVSTAAQSAAAVAAAGGVGGSAGAAAFVAAGAFALGASAIAVGATMGYLIVDNLTGDLVRIPLTATNPVPLPSVVSLPPLPASAVYSFSPSFPDLFPYVDLYSQAVQDYANWKNNSDVDCNILIISTDSNNQTIVTTQSSKTGRACGSTWSNVTQNFPVSVSQLPIRCNANFTLTNGFCIPNNPRAVPDYSIDYSRSGTSLSVAAGEVDAAGAVVSLLPTGALLIQDQTASGEPRHYKIIPQVDGGSNVEIYEPVTNAVGDTGTKKVVIAVSPSGVVTGKTQTTTGEQLGQDPVTGLPVVNPAPVGTTFTPSSPSGSSVTFPSDYARAGEAQTASEGVKTRLDTLHSDLSSTTSISDPTEPGSVDMPGWGSTFSGLLGWNLPAHGSSCPTPNLDLGFMGLGTHSMTMHCTLINDHFDALNAAMMAVWTVLALFVVLRA